MRESAADITAAAPEAEQGAESGQAVAGPVASARRAIFRAVSVVASSRRQSGVRWE